MLKAQCPQLQYSIFAKKFFARGLQFTKFAKILIHKKLLLYGSSPTIGLYTQLGPLSDVQTLKDIKEDIWELEVNEHCSFYFDY